LVRIIFMTRLLPEAAAVALRRVVWPEHLLQLSPEPILSGRSSGPGPDQIPGPASAGPRPKDSRPAAARLFISRQCCRSRRMKELRRRRHRSAAEAGLLYGALPCIETGWPGNLRRTMDSEGWSSNHRGHARDCHCCSKGYRSGEFSCSF